MGCTCSHSCTVSLTGGLHRAAIRLRGLLMSSQSGALESTGRREERREDQETLISQSYVFEGL